LARPLLYRRYRHSTITKPFEAHMEAINCHHNYVQREHHFGKNVWVTRKGAVSAQKGQLGIIPGSMGACSYIVRGKGHEDAFCSCSHGAGLPRGDRAYTQAGCLRERMKQGAPAGDFLKDQLLLPIALPGKGALLATTKSSHTKTNVTVIEKLLLVSVEVARHGDGMLISLD
jgi:RNA 3'-terminal phosphate cyclase